MDKEKDIITSWQVNAQNWIELIGKNGIESRNLVTNQAIIDAVISVHPKTVLDIGCGEGWLCEKLNANSISVTGIDIIPELIDNARLRTPGNFFVGSYNELASHAINFNEKFDVIVINFALLAKETTENLLAALPDYLNEKGYLFIQTLHPHHRKELNDYTTGWKEGSWEGLGEKFTQLYEWYFRTLEDWQLLLDRSGFKDVKVQELLHPYTQLPLSVIFWCRI